MVILLLHCTCGHELFIISFFCRTIGGSAQHFSSRHGAGVHNGLQQRSRTHAQFPAASAVNESGQWRQSDSPPLTARVRVFERPTASPTPQPAPRQTATQSTNLKTRSRTPCLLSSRTNARGTSGGERLSVGSQQSLLASLDPQLKRRLELPAAHLTPFLSRRRAHDPSELRCFFEKPEAEKRPPLVNWDARLTERDFGVIDGLMASARDGFPPETLKRWPPIARPAEYYEREPSRSGAFNRRPSELYCDYVTDAAHESDYIW